MFELNKLCDELERLNPVDRSVMLVEKSVLVVKRLKGLGMPFNPVKTLATFIIGSIVSDGVINEKEYLFIYPSLKKAFGDDFDLLSVKRTLQLSKDIQKEISKSTEELMSVINVCDEDLANDIITLCLLIASVDGKISMKEKRYIRKLCKA